MKTAVLLITTSMPFFIKTEKFTKKTLSLRLEDRKKYLTEHKDWVQNLKESGFNISSGYLINNQKKPGGGGVLVLEAESFEQAKFLILQDPIIKNNLVTWEINEWVSVVGCLLAKI